MNDRDTLTQHNFADRVFCRLYTELKQPLYSYLLCRTKNPHLAQDLSQDVFLLFWVMRHRYAEIGDLRSYLFQMARNAFFEIGRREMRQRSYEECIEQQPVRAENLTQVIFDEREAQRKLQQAILLLTPHRKVIYVLSKLEGWPRNKIAIALGISESTVKNTLQNAIKDIEKLTGFIRE